MFRRPGQFGGGVAYLWYLKNLLSCEIHLWSLLSYLSNVQGVLLTVVLHAKHRKQDSSVIVLSKPTIGLKYIHSGQRSAAVNEQVI